MPITMLHELKNSLQRRLQGVSLILGDAIRQTREKKQKKKRRTSDDIFYKVTKQLERRDLTRSGQKSGSGFVINYLL